MGALSPSQDDSGVVPVGAVLAGRYRIDGVLGKGGMGRVYRGEHTGIGKPVAIKVLHADLGRNKEAAARFQREAMASGRLDHPNIVGVSDFGVLDDGCLFLVMEVLEGESLGKRLEREGPIAWPEALQITRGVLFGLRHAHDRGVVHRDIKPDNIFLARKDGEQVVKILDFGIAKLYAGNADDPASTRAGLTVGTPAYLSPEQAVGGAITPASDLYSTSIVLYEMLVGKVPFDDLDPLQMLTAHVGKEPPMFDEVAPKLELPAGLEDIVRHGLQKVSAERIGTANEYLARIEQILRGQGVEFNSGPISVASQSVGIPMGPHVPTPRPGSQPGFLEPSADFMATPMPFAAITGSGPAPSSPALPRVSRALFDHDGDPIPRKWMAVAAVVLVVAVAGAIVLLSTGGKGEQGSVLAPPPPVIVPLPQVAPVDDETRLKAALHDLEDGVSCADRKAAIPKLVELGDPKAIPALKKARYRGRGGVLGIGESNSNACLRSEADAAIKALGGTLK